jgi:hypothetical protein
MRHAPSGERVQIVVPLGTTDDIERRTMIETATVPVEQAVANIAED